MYYNDVIADPNYSTPNDTGGRTSYGDSQVAELIFATAAEATVAAYLMEAVGGRSNNIAKSLTHRLGSMVSSQEVRATSGEAPLHLYAGAAREVRRAVKEVAEGDSSIRYQLANIPESIIRAAQQLHYHPAAHDIGSTLPTQTIPQTLDLERAPQDLKAAISDIANIEKERHLVGLSNLSPSGEFAAVHIDALLDSIEHPIAA
jgi:hypothetical protein